MYVCMYVYMYTCIRLFLYICACFSMKLYIQTYLDIIHINIDKEYIYICLLYPWIPCNFRGLQVRCNEDGGYERVGRMALDVNASRVQGFGLGV